LRFLTELVLGQAGLATPLVFALCIAGALLAVRLGLRRREPGWTLLALFTAIPTAVFVQHALGDRVQANWPAVVYPSAVIAAAGVQGRFWTRLRVPAIGLGVAITGAAYLQAAAAPFPLPVLSDPTAIRLDGWQQMAAQVELARRAAAATFVAADSYSVAAELAWRLPASVPVVAVGSRWRYFDLLRPDLAGESGLLVDEGRSLRPWAGVEPKGTVSRTRGGQTIKAYRLYLVTGRERPGTSEAVLPRP
jgi:hypothetical protein